MTSFHFSYRWLPTPGILISVAHPPSFVEAFGIPASKISQPLYFGAVISLDVQPLATGADLHS